ncbi:MAG: bifunctional 5,10-methylenetetrahydrofolate dehydrogenase/5,10-methenyltetrahydrofolate cyclohydrolase [Candidatus Delongbacteria bacterium]|nr:bifunctional 5,10-methylenetetrahydrofolate dehydrogenase/5,10-methenyltetrahydrofolate cyclohydrolase [Candidatus Delongbacteria bacterium]MBN2833434.1 bifunctional 5,10-methylenetetrahydrofolate dehydrogenase/5,10-methenyltetrahydrofolate cyclohydrolase [Candidatus Delongbacteria bacterium]
MNDSRIIKVGSIIDIYDIPVFEKHLKVYRENNIKPKMSAILTSDDAGSVSYMKGIARFCKKWNVDFESFTVSNSDELESLIFNLNKSETNGIMVMYPSGFDKKDTFFMNLVDPEKDLEGLNTANLGYLVQFEKFRDASGLRKYVIPPTAKGILYIFKRNYTYFEEHKERFGIYPESQTTNPYQIEGKRITIINDSLAVGRSLALMMLNEAASVQVCHKYTPFEDILKFVSQSDIIVSAVPSSKFVLPTSIVPENAIVIDISFEGNFEYPEIIDKVYKIAPRWDLVKKGDRINDITLYRLISNLFYLVNLKLNEEILEKIYGE